MEEEYPEIVLKEVVTEREKQKQDIPKTVSKIKLPIGNIFENIKNIMKFEIKPKHVIVQNSKDTSLTSIQNPNDSFIISLPNIKANSLSSQTETSVISNEIKNEMYFNDDQSFSSDNETKFTLPVRKNGSTSFQIRNNIFRYNINRIAKKTQKKMIKNKLKIHLSERERNFNLYKRVCLLRYRDHAFRAAEKISYDLPEFPVWSYKNLPTHKLDIISINVGGKKFQVFRDTLLSIPYSKLCKCYINHVGEPEMFFDRDATCFNYIINFFRSGKLHAPTNSCLSFYEDELQFWGINEDLMEPCCYSQYMANKNTCNTLTMYSDNKGKEGIPETGKYDFKNIKKKLYLICTSADSGLLGSWYSMLCGMAILLSIITMIFSTSVEGRIDRETKMFSPRKTDESIVEFFGRTDVHPSINSLDMFLVTSFFLDLLMRFTMCPDKLLFFADTINWIDFVATISSLLSNLSRKKVENGEFEAYILLLKMPRVLRLFRLTKYFRSGIDAVVLTFLARSSELKLVLVLTLITICTYGALIYVIELVNESKDEKSNFRSIYDGIWFAIVTMSTVGYGDITPRSPGGYMIGLFCILTGIIISQLPVPIFLTNFSGFYTQIQSSERDMDKVLNQNIDPENFITFKPKKAKSFKEFINSVRI